MASLKKRGRIFWVYFWWEGKQYAKSLQVAAKDDAERIKRRVETAIKGLKRGQFPNASKLIADGFDIRDIIFPNHKTAHLLEGGASADDGNPLTISQLRDDYKEYLQNHVTYGTRRRTLSRIARLVELRGECRVAQFSLDVLEQYISARKKSKASAQTINGELSDVRAMMNWAVTTKRISESPISKYPMLKIDDPDPFLFKADLDKLIDDGRLDTKTAKKLRKKRMILSPHDIGELISLAREKSPELVLPLMLVSTTGMRRVELVRLRKQDFDSDRGRLFVRSGKGSKRRFTTRTLDVHVNVLPELRRHYASLPRGQRLLLPVFDIPKSGKATKSLVPIEDRRADRAGRLLKQLLNNSEFRLLSGWHALRHSFITICVWKGYSFEQISQWSGHINEVTQRRYTHYDSEASKQLINNLPFTFAGADS